MSAVSGFAGACRSYWLMVISYWAEAESPSPSAFALLRRDKHSSPEQGRGGRRREQRSGVRVSSKLSTLNYQLSTSGTSRSETRRVPARMPEAMRCCREKCCARLCLNWRHGLGTRYADANRTCRRRCIAKGPSVAMAKYIAARSDN